MDATSHSTTFYVYVLARPNGRVFYVGKGKGRRVFEHDIEARSGHQCYKCNVIRKIWKQGGTVQRYFVFTTENEQEALDYECELIALYGRANLTNLTDGGQGTTGQKQSAETIRKRVEANRGRILSEQARQNIRDAARRRQPKPDVIRALVERNHARKGSKRDPEAIRKTAERQRGKTISTGQRQKLSEIMKGRKRDPEAVRKTAEANRGREHSEEARQLMSESCKRRSADPEYRQKLSEAIKGKPKSDEHRRKLSEAAKERYRRRG